MPMMMTMIIMMSMPMMMTVMNDDDNANDDDRLDSCHMASCSFRAKSKQTFHKLHRHCLALILTMTMIIRISNTKHPKNHQIAAPTGVLLNAVPAPPSFFILLVFAIPLFLLASFSLLLKFILSHFCLNLIFNLDSCCFCAIQCQQSTNPVYSKFLTSIYVLCVCIDQ